MLCHTCAKESAPETINGYKFTGKYHDSGLHGPGSAAEYIQEEHLQKKAVRPQKRTQYIYHDEDGREIVRVNRLDDGQGNRKFWQEPKVNGKWLKKGVDQVKGQIHLYRIFDPLNREAIANDQPILLVEGEGKVDLLMSMGIGATCSLNGSGKWRGFGYPNYLEDLKGARVVICPDRDAPGLAHADDIAKDFPDAQWLYAFPDSSVWNRPPQDEGLDIADWIRDYRLSAEDVLKAVGDRRATDPSQEEKPTVDQFEEMPKFLKAYRLVESRLGDRLKFNGLFKRIELDGEEFDVGLAKVSLIVNHRIPIQASREDIGDIITSLAKQKAYNPVVQYLDAVHSKYGNTTSPIEGIAKRYFGSDSPLHQVLLKKFLVSCVARAYEPGCQCDSVLILQGKQGYGKSSFFRILASQDWFDDSMGSASDRDERLKLHLVWIVEWAELENVFKRKDISQVKALITCRADLVRRPYDRSHENMKRVSVIVGTTNQKQFLADTTGNRRFWVIPIQHPIDRAMLQRERDQIWAAAVTLYRAGEPWHLTDEQEAQIEQEREVYRIQDVWLDSITQFTASRDMVTVGGVLKECLNIDQSQENGSQSRRVRDILYQLGFEPCPSSVLGPEGPGKRRYWRRVSNPS